MFDPVYSTVQLKRGEEARSCWKVLVTATVAVAGGCWVDTFCGACALVGPASRQSAKIVDNISAQDFVLGIGNP